jgi:hypothetical protein
VLWNLKTQYVILKSHHMDKTPKHTKNPNIVHIKLGSNNKQKIIKNKYLVANTWQMHFDDIFPQLPKVKVPN